MRRITNDDRDLLADQAQPPAQHDPHDEAITTPAIVPGTVAMAQEVPNDS